MKDTTIVSIDKKLHKKVKQYAEKQGFKLYKAYSILLEKALELVKKWNPKHIQNKYY